MKRTADDDDRDLEQALEESSQRLFNPRTEQERKKAEKELDEHTARPGLTDDIEKLMREFEIRLKRIASLPPCTPPGYKEAFSPFLERMVTIPPHDKQRVVGWDLWTQHMVKFYFQYGLEPLFALLGLKAFALLSPAPGIFEKATSDPNEIERTRKTREVVERVEVDVAACVSLASEYFVEALRGRLGTVVDQTANEITVRAVSELMPKLNNAGERCAAALRKAVLDEWASVEKVRLGTPPPGPSTFRTKEEFELLLDEAQEKLKSVGVDRNKTSVVGYINTHYPQVRCGSVKQLNRWLKKFELEHKFPGIGEEGGGQI